MSKPTIKIEQKWIDVLKELDQKLIASGKQPWGNLEDDRSTDSVTYLELTAIASTKDREALEKVCYISYEEDEDCDSKSVENDILRDTKNTKDEYWEFEVAPLDRSHPQVPDSYGFVVAETYEAAKAILLSLPDSTGVNE
jgi:hypothetical protein